MPTLLEEIQAKATPELIAAQEHGQIAALVSAGRKTMDTTTKFSSLGISERFPALGPMPGPLAAESVFQKLEGFAAVAMASSDPLGKLLGAACVRQMTHLKAQGMAIGSPAVGAMLQAIVAQGGLTQAEVDALVSVAQVDNPVSVQEVINAMKA